MILAIDFSAINCLDFGMFWQLGSEKTRRKNKNPWLIFQLGIFGFPVRPTYDHTVKSNGSSKNKYIMWYVIVSKYNFKIPSKLYTLSAQIERHSWVESHGTHFGRTITVVQRGALLIFCFLNFFSLGINWGHMKRTFWVLRYIKLFLRPKMTLESVGFEPTTTFCQSKTLKSVILNFNFHIHTSMCQRSHEYLEVLQILNFYGEKVSTLLNFAESGNNSLKIGKITKSSKKL